MRKIYESFEELIKQNQGLFSLLKKKDSSTFRAIWDARQAEIDEYKVAIDELYKQINFEQKQNKQYKELLEKSTLECEELERKSTELENFLSVSTTEFTEELFQKEKMIGYLNQKFNEKVELIGKLHQEAEQKERYQKSLETAVKMASSQNLQKSLDQKDKELEEKEERESLLLKEIANLKNRQMELNQELEDSLKDLEESKSYARQYKAFNNKMANELQRVNDQLSKTALL